MLIIALAGAGSIQGYICLDCSRRAHAWRDEESAFLRTGADIIAAAMLRHEAEQALRAQQANLASMVAERTRLFRYLFSSEPHCRRILKCSPAECIGKTDVELAARARARGHRQGFGEVCFNSDVATRNAGRPCQFIEEASLDDEYLALEVHKTPLFNEHGVFTGIVGSTRDVTQRKRVERAIRESEARYRTIFEQSPIALWELNATALKDYLTELEHAGITDLRDYFTRNPEKLQACAAKICVVDVNYTGLALMGAASRAQLMRPFRQTCAPATWPVFLELCIAIAHGAPLFEGEMPVCTLDGRERMCLARWVVANHAAVQILRAESKAQVLPRIDRTFVEQSRRDFARQLVSMARGGQVFECESVMRRFDGTLIHVAIRIAVMPGHEATHTCVIDSFADITARVRAVEAIKVSEEKFRLL